MTNEIDDDSDQEYAEMLKHVMDDEEKRLRMTNLRPKALKS